MAGSFPGLISPFPPRLATTEKLFSLLKSERQAELPTASTLAARTARPPFAWVTEILKRSLRTAHGFWR